MLATQKQELGDLLERIPLLLRADQMKPVETSIVEAIEALDLKSCDMSELTARERVALGNYYTTICKPVEALQCYWSAVRDGDEYTRSVATNNAGVIHFGFCPGMASNIIEEVV